MDTSRISLGERIAGAGAVALLICLFLPWYGVEIDFGGGSSASGNATGWEALSIIDILLFLIVLVTIGVVAAKAAGSLPSLPAPPAQILLGAGVFALLLVLFRIIDVPTPDGVPDAVEDDLDIGRKVGVFLSLIAAGAMAYGGFSAQSGPAPRPAPSQRPEPPAATP